MKIFYTLCLLTFSLFGFSQVTLPVDFESMIDYKLTDFGGNASSIVVDPTDATNMVAQSIKTGTAETWAGTTIGGDEGFDNPIPFTMSNTVVTVRVWSPDAGIQIRLKTEKAFDPTITVETEATTTVAGDWETLEFDFSNEAPGTAALNLANTYNKMSIFFNFGTTGADAGEKTYYWDDVMFVPGGLDQIDLPVNFEEANTDYTMTDFGGNASMVVEDPTDATNTVAMVVKSNTAEVWAGTTIGTDAGFATPVPFTPAATKMSMMVWSPDAGIPVRLKAEDSSDPTITVETETLTTMAGAWEMMEFDFSNEVAGTAALNTANSYNKASVFFNFGTTGADAGEKTYYFDDVEFVPGPTINQIDLPVTFEDPDTDYTMTDFGGNASSVVEDPTDPTNTVAMVIKSNTAELWAGTTVGTDAGFASAIPFSVTATEMSVMVWSPDAGIPVRLKVENAGDPTISVETETVTTMAGAWESMVFDFSNEVAGTAALNLANTYNKASLFFNFGTTGADAGEKTYYFDDVEFVGGPVINQIDLPVTFEDPDTDYTMTDFGGNASSVVEDPTDPTNTVAQAIKTATAELWAGTTIGTNAGFASSIPFTMDQTQMSVMVWSPDAGVPVRLKVEAAGDPTISVETEASTTMAGAWEMLVFDFSNEVAGTAALNLANTYNKASIFFNFGTTGADAGEKTYYFDNVQMAGDQLTIFEIIAASPNHTILETAILAAGLEGTLSAPGTLTVFAPTDAAFAALPPGTVDALLMDPTGALTQVLLYHVLDHVVLAADISDGQMETTLQGEDLAFSISNDSIYINTAYDAIPDIMADNGVVHVLDGALIPPSILGVEILNAEDFDIALQPNPANDKVLLTMPEGFDGQFNIQLYTMQGRQVYSNTASGKTNEIQLDGLNSGLYLVTIQFGKSIYATKLMIQK